MNPKRNIERDDVGDERVVRDGHLLIEEEIVRGEGLVTYEDAVAGQATASVVAQPAATVPCRRGAVVEPIPSMTNDNTDTTLETTGSMMAVSAASQVINLVREGMRVVDVNGEELGKVDYAKMGDPGAATVGADAPGEPGFIEAVFVGEGEPDVPEPLRSRLLRLGFLKIDGKGWIDTDRYVTADLIGRVSGDNVTLTVAKDRVLSDEA